MITPKIQNSDSVWALTKDEILHKFNLEEERGLTMDEVQKRATEYGANDIQSSQKRKGLRIFISQFESPLVLLLIGAAVLSYFVGDGIDSIVILAIVFLSSILGFFQEYKAERALRELRKLVTIHTKVLREGLIQEMDSKELVPGDIIHLNIGDIVPADTRLIFVDDCSINESSLTGESLPVTKTTELVSVEKTQPQDISNMAFMGTSIASGRAIGVVASTGMSTFLGKTAKFLKEDPQTDFQKSINQFGNFLLKITFAMTLFILVANAVLGKPFFDSLLFAIALAVGITPEVLPILMTIALSSGALKMAKQNVITKTLASVEDIGNIDILCSDKTGTLTTGELILEKYEDSDGNATPDVLLHASLCTSTGNALDDALLANDEVKKLSHKVLDFKVIDENEFDFERRRMSVLVESTHSPADRILIVKGGAESVLTVCDLPDSKKKEIHTRIESFEANGYRVIAIAIKKFTADTSKKEDENALTFLGFLLFLDPAKESARDALKLFQKLKIEVKILSGDSAAVTRKICNDVNFVIAQNRVMTGDELGKMTIIEFENACRSFNVFARVTPEQKYQIVSLLNKDGHIVGFLGDGINDAPALKAADVGISVDSATGIAKEAADIILLQKSLHILAEGIIEGRKIFGNIMKYILNTISANFGNMFTVASASLFLNFIPLLPSQILLNNFISDFPLLTIATDNVDPELLKKPKRWNLKLISRFMIYFGIISTVFDLALILPLIFVVKVSPELFRTAWFVESALSEIVITFSIRTKSFFYKNRPSNWLLWSSLITIGITFAITYIGFSKEIFNFVAMPLGVVLYIAAILGAYFLTSEVAKRYFFKKFEL